MCRGLEKKCQWRCVKVKRKGTHWYGPALEGSKRSFGSPKAESIGFAATDGSEDSKETEKVKQESMC